ncbi:MAG: MBL fold metallo-hydrolase [Steroidobacter sp.]
MKMWIVALAITALTTTGLCAELDEKVWIHGSEDCGANRDPAIEIFQFDPATFILRQNKCVHFEAPFIYVLFGEHTVFVQDTGATEEPERFPIYDVVQKLIAQRARPASAPSLRVLVTHSHSHGDHTAGDLQFRGKPGVTLIEPNAQAVREHFGFALWPEGMAKIDLGARELLVLPAPGHQDESVAVYDPQTGWLMTGDSLYPGQLYVRDWDVYKESIRRLVEFSRSHRISAVMGTHIEMSRTPGKIFARGSTFQPGEAGLALSVEDLLFLDESLRQAGAQAKDLTTPKFVVVPIGAFQRALGDMLKWLSKW